MSTIKHKDRILDFLKKEKSVGYCDDCLSAKLQIFPRQQVNQICRKLLNQGTIRKRGFCASCRKNKILNFYEENREKIIAPPEVPQKEEQIREKMSEFLGVLLEKDKLSIFGKEKEFDLVNIEAKVVGDIKSYTYKGLTPSAEFSAMCEYVWLMEKLEKSSGGKWRKIIVGSGNKKTFENYAKKYHPWLGDVEIYFLDDEGKVQKIREGVKLYFTR